MKRSIIMALCIMLCASLAIGGTMAYLSDTASNVNVMTLGNVKIQQLEYERARDAAGNLILDDGAEEGSDDWKLVPFTQNKPLLPATSTFRNADKDPQDWDDVAEREGNPNVIEHKLTMYNVPNVQDKLVFVENTGKSDAYVRTLVALEAGALAENDKLYSYVQASYSVYWDQTKVGYIEIDGTTYLLQEYLYRAAPSDRADETPTYILGAGEISAPSIMQIIMLPNAKNSHVEKVDGNKNGTYDILVCSQAVQVAGFEGAGAAHGKLDAEYALDEAFGDITVTNHPWKNGNVVIPNYVTNEEEFNAAGSHIVLGNDIVMDDEEGTIVDGGETVVIDLNGNYITADRNYVGGGQTMEDITTLVIDGADVIIEGKGGVVNTAEKGAYAIAIKNGANVTIKDGYYEAYYDTIYMTEGTLTIEGGFFKAGDDKDGNPDQQANGYDSEAGGTKTWCDGRCDKSIVINLKDNNYLMDSEGNRKADVRITGGTFVNFNPTRVHESQLHAVNYVQDGYKVISETQDNGDIWYTVVPE